MQYKYVIDTNQPQKEENIAICNTTDDLEGIVLSEITQREIQVIYYLT